MAEVSYLHHDDDDDHRHHALVSFSPHNNRCPYDGFDVYPPDLDFLCRRRRPSPMAISPRHNVSHRENPVYFVPDMFHQRVEQSQSQSQPHSMPSVIEENPSNRSFGVVEGNDDMNFNDFEVDFGSGLGFPVENHDSCNDDNSGFIIADRGDEFFYSRSTRASHGARSEPGYSSSRSGAPEFFMRGLRVIDIGSDSDEAAEDEIVEVEDESAMDGGCDDEASLELCWDAFHLEDDNITVDSNLNSNTNEDFEWEEVDGRIDQREALSMFFGAEADDDASVLPGIPPGGEDQEALEWEVLLNVHNIEPTTDSAGPYDDYNYTEYEMFFGQFADSDVSALGRPPASKMVVQNLSLVVMTQEDVEKNNALCAVCKDEISLGDMAKQLPCSHHYHGDCILPWLHIRNTCPVCRQELPTDDPDYERRKAEGVVLAR